MWRRFLLHLYYQGTRKRRARANARRAALRAAPAMVLFYHRVAEDRANSWTCSFATFARQMDWLRERFDLVSLAEVQRRLRSGANDRPCVSVTFDDGYADNCRRALPFLIEEQIPCTYFVAARFVLEGNCFPHDLAMGNKFPPNTVQQLRDLAEAGIEIGAHTRTHADLGQCRDEDTLYDEVVAARDDLEDALNRPIHYFAFPYGLAANLNPRVFSLAAAHGYKAVCSAYGGYNFPGDDPFHLQRIHGGDDMIRLKNWTTLDPRKLKITRYEYRTAVDDRATELVEAAAS